MTTPKQSSIHERLLDVLTAHPDGISITDIRHELNLKPTEHQHLDRRVRDLDRAYNISREQSGRSLLYKLLGPKDSPSPADPVDRTTAARIRHLAGYRCQMCGRTVADDAIRLHIDHKVPRDWGGSNEDENLWAVCSQCNEGKRNYFASVTDPRVRSAIAHGSVHVRIGELLKAFERSPVPKAYIQMVAYTHDDYEKRLRELRELGWRYRALRRKEGTRVRTYFILDHWEPWPADPATAIKAAELRKKARRTNG